MSDDGGAEILDLNPTKQWAHHIAASNARARQFLLTAPRCDKCGHPVGTPGRSRHFLCDPDSYIGHPCVCPPECSNKRYGDGPRECDPACRPCYVNKGQPVREKKGKP